MSSRSPTHISLLALSVRIDMAFPSRILDGTKYEQISIEMTRCLELGCVPRTLHRSNAGNRRLRKDRYSKTGSRRPRAHEDNREFQRGSPKNPKPQPSEQRKPQSLTRTPASSKLRMITFSTIHDRIAQETVS